MQNDQLERTSNVTARAIVLGAAIIALAVLATTMALVAEIGDAIGGAHHMQAGYSMTSVGYTLGGVVIVLIVLFSGLAYLRKG